MQTIQVSHVKILYNDTYSTVIAAPLGPTPSGFIKVDTGVKFMLLSK